MGKLAKVRGSFVRAKNAAKNITKGEGVGSLGHEIVVIGVHAGLGLASKNGRQLGPIPVAPDVAGALVGLGMMTFGKGKVRKLGKSVAKGGAHAVLSRWLYDESFSLVSGPDGFRKAESQESAPASE